MGVPPAAKAKYTSPIPDICFRMGWTWGVESSFYLQEALGLRHTNRQTILHFPITDPQIFYLFIY